MQAVGLRFGGEVYCQVWSSKNSSSRINPFKRNSVTLNRFTCKPTRSQTPTIRKVGAPVSAREMSNGVTRHVKIPPPAHPTYQLLDIIRYALAEDAGDRGDVTCLSTIPENAEAKAQFMAKADGIVAGIAMADLIFREVDPELQVEWTLQDGDEVKYGLKFGTVSGSARSILVAERIALNFMQRMSGIATFTRRMAEAAKPARILETRKTAPGLRLVDKWAVLIGGGENHRMGLYDMFLVKDNHIDVAGGIENAVTAVDRYMKEQKLDLGVEIETRSLDEVREVLDCIRGEKGKVTRIMLDNMVKVTPDGSVDVSMLEEAVKLIDGRVETEASGNVTLQTVSKIGATGVTYISSGALTHSVEALDVSLKVDVGIQYLKELLPASGLL
ncbi:hypothetical protein R1sor_013199 [Riccia sorocarpa]|uniref:nicotinate-nucleotide diphosphorylase (carboxylating) n=1 Tax=Riccia sorocarpa TaxID=122646 RepID=A0ABD3H951_9MARC